MPTQLPTWSVQPIAAEVAPVPLVAPVGTGGDPSPETQGSGNTSRFALIGVASVLVLGLIGYALFGGSSSSTTDQAGETTASSEAPSTTDADAATSDTSTSTDETATDGTVTDGSATDETGTDETAAGDPEPETAEPAINDGNRRAIFSAGVVYLQGSVPNVEIGNEIERKAGLVVGPDNVRNEYVIDPSVHFDPNVGAPLYVDDFVLFAPNSTVIEGQFVPLLNLGVILLEQNPQVTIDVIGHTDSVGSEESNLILSQERVNAVLAYWGEAGIDTNRITAIGMGEAQPVADNSTPDGKQINRRVEFVIKGLLAD